jgi:MYXO-CTERM domain-containing protein
MIEPSHAHHGEGHIAFTVTPALPSPAPSPRLNTPEPNSPAFVSPLTIGIAAGAVALIVVAALIARRRRRR